MSVSRFSKELLLKNRAEHIDKIGIISFILFKGSGKLNDIELWHGDCLELMKDIPDKSVDMIFTDLT